MCSQSLLELHIPIPKPPFCVFCAQFLLRDQFGPTIFFHTPKLWFFNMIEFYLGPTFLLDSFGVEKTRK